MQEESGAGVYSHVVGVGTAGCIKQNSASPFCPVGKDQGLSTLGLAPKHRLLWALSLKRKIQIEVSKKEHHLCSYIWKEKKHSTTKMRAGQGLGANDPTRLLTPSTAYSPRVGQASSLQHMDPSTWGDYMSFSGEKVTAFIRYLALLEPQNVENHCIEGLTE